MAWLRDLACSLLLQEPVGGAYNGVETRQQACFVPSPLLKLEPEHLQRNSRAIALIKKQPAEKENGKTVLKLEIVE